MMYAHLYTAARKMYGVAVFVITTVLSNYFRHLFYN